MIVLYEMPMPCSVNKKLMVAQGRMIKTKEARAFDQACQIWMLRQRSALYDYRKQAKEWIDVGYVLKIEYNFYFPKKNVICKDGSAKKVDVSNRIKDAEDAVGDVIDLDDKYFVTKLINKIPWDKSYECFTAIITPTMWPVDLKVALGV